MQLLFKKSAMHVIPASPICFKIYKGMLLIPGLLFALKFFSSTVISSAVVIHYFSAASMGVYLSVGMDWS